jgi:hypothetical protein
MRLKRFRYGSVTSVTNLMNAASQRLYGILGIQLRMIRMKIRTRYTSASV